MMNRKTAPYRTVAVVGAIVCGIGALVILGGLAFNWATANDGGGANIGAALIVFAGVGVAACGMLTFLIGLIAHLSVRHR